MDELAALSQDAAEDAASEGLRFGYAPIADISPGNGEGF